MNMETLLKTSLSGAVLILLVLGLRAAVAGRVSRKWTVLLWDVGLLRLLTPWFVEIPVYRLTQQTPHLLADASAMPQASGGLMCALFWIWCGGAAIAAAFLIRRYVIERSVLATALPISQSPEEEARCLALLPAGHAYRLYICQGLATPVAAGIFRQRIILPAHHSQWEDSTLRSALTHEAAHLKSHDILQKLVMSLTTVIHWFNPLVWLMAGKLNRDLEAACDERAIRLLGKGSLREYASALLDLQVQQNALFFCTAGFGASATKERICLLLSKKKCTVATVLTMVLISILCTTVFAAPVPIAATESAPAHSQEVVPTIPATTSPSTQVDMDDQSDYLVTETFFTIDTDTGEIRDETGDLVGHAYKEGSSYLSVADDDASVIISVQRKTQQEDGSVLYSIHEESSAN